MGHFGGYKRGQAPIVSFFFDLDSVKQFLDLALQVFLGLTVSLAEFLYFLVGPFGELSFQFVESLLVEFLNLLVFQLVYHSVFACKGVVDHLYEQERLAAL